MIMVLLLIVPSVVRADLFGGDVAILSQMYSNMVQQLKTLREELDNIKAVNSTLKDTYKAIDSVRKEYDFWQNVDVKRDMDDVVDHYLDGTVIDELVETDDPYVRYDPCKSAH